MTDYPNREHEQADKAAERRALKALSDIVTEANHLRSKIGREVPVDGDDTQIIADRMRELTKNLAILGVLAEVREWHAADMDTAAAEVFGTTHQGRAIDARNNTPAGGPR